MSWKSLIIVFLVLLAMAAGAVWVLRGGLRNATSPLAALQSFRGQGLSGVYMLATSHPMEEPVNVVLKRVDPQIDFDWSTKSPGPKMTSENFSVRWTGKVRVDTAGTYILAVNSDDGIILSIDGKRIVDDWVMHGLTAYRKPIELTAGLHDVQLDYLQLTGKSVIQLKWVPPGGQEIVIPADHLVPS